MIIKRVYIYKGPEEEEKGRERAAAGMSRKRTTSFRRIIQNHALELRPTNALARQGALRGEHRTGRFAERFRNVRSECRVVPAPPRVYRSRKRFVDRRIYITIYCRANDSICTGGSDHYEYCVRFFEILSFRYIPFNTFYKKIQFILRSIYYK